MTPRRSFRSSSEESGGVGHGRWARVLRLLGLAWIIRLLGNLGRRALTRIGGNGDGGGSGAPLTAAETDYFLPAADDQRNDTDRQGDVGGRNEPPAPPCNYGDWRSLLENADSCPPGLEHALQRGEIPTGAVPQVFELIRRFCERMINREGRRLSRELEAITANDTDGIVLLCTRYAHSCERLLFFTGVQGMPEHEGGQLAAQIRGHVQGVLHSVANGIGSGSDSGGSAIADDMTYAITRLERRWMRA